MKWVVIALLLIVALLAWRVLRPTVRVRVGEPAPEFQLPDQQGTQHRLTAYRGRWLVLYFYPRDDTPGCTREACQFRDDSPQLQSLHAQVVGVSVDAADSHARFAAKYHLSFPLLADTQGLVAAQYGALIKLGPLKMARRITFIIAPDGRVAHLFPRVDPDKHVMEVTRILKDLQTRATAG